MEDLGVCLGVKMERVPRQHSHDFQLIPLLSFPLRCLYLEMRHVSGKIGIVHWLKKFRGKLTKDARKTRLMDAFVLRVGVFRFSSSREVASSSENLTSRLIFRAMNFTYATRVECVTSPNLGFDSSREKKKK